MTARRMGALLIGAALLLGSAGLLTARDAVEAQEDPAAGLQLQAGFTNVAYLGPTLPLPEALTNAADTVAAIWSFQAGANGPPWLLWSALLPAPLQGFDALTYGRAYFFVASADVFWEYGAGQIGEPPPSVNLLMGLNHIVYFGETLPVEEALGGPESAGLRSQQAGALGCVRLIWSFGTNWTLWDQTLPQALLGFTQLGNGAAYFVGADQPCTWTFTTGSGGPGTEPEPPAGLDFGDAPDSYGTTTAADGARHTVVEGVFLGATVDIESDGQPGGGADTDDNADEDDEDGVGLPAQLTAGGSVTFQVTASTAGFLDAWIDFGGDGRFDEPGDRIFTSEPLVAGVNTLSVFLPAEGTQAGDTFVRFRFSLAGGLGPTGAAPDGEVEDYRIPIDPDDPPPPPPGCPPAVIICS